jgi:hypothetical protein
MSEFDRLPTVNELRVDAQAAMESNPSVPFGRLVPGLDTLGDEAVDVNMVSSRLWHVLLRWQGSRWIDYLDESPATLLARRSCGWRSLGEFLWLANRAARTGPRRFMEAVISADSTEDATGDSSTAIPPSSNDRSHAIQADLIEIAAWAHYEHGRVGLKEALLLAWNTPSAPPSVLDAMTDLEGVDLAQLTLDRRDAFDVRAMLDWIKDSMSDRERDIASRRTLALSDRETLDDVGRTHNLTRERVRQVQTKLDGRLRKHLRGASTQPLQRLVERIRDEVGLASPLERTSQVSSLAELGLTDLDSFAVRFLLWAAGPYEVVGDWIVRTPAKHQVQITKAKLTSLGAGGPISLTEAQSQLSNMGIPETNVLEWIVSVGGYRIHQESVLPWSGSMADKVVVLLSISGAPMAQEELFENLGENRSLRSMVNQLQNDQRIKRTGLRSYGLREWEHDEYTGIADEIAQEIERQGGSASLEHLARYVSQTYGVSENSVRAYAFGPRFSRNSNGDIQRQGESSTKRYRKPIELVRGAVHTSDGWALRLRVSEAQLGGSGTPIPEAIALEFGLEPLGELILQLDGAPLRLTWPTLLPQLGSIRAALSARDAQVGDHVLVSLHGLDAHLRVIRARDLADQEGLVRLAAELAVEGPGDNLERVSAAVGLADEIPSLPSIRRRLMARGDADLVNMLGPEGDEPVVLNLNSGRFVEVKWSS